MRAGQSARIILPLLEGVNRLCDGKEPEIHESRALVAANPIPAASNKLRPSGVLLFEQFCGPIRGIVLITMAISKNPKAKNRNEMKPAYPFFELAERLRVFTALKTSTTPVVWASLPILRARNPTTS